MTIAVCSGFVSTSQSDHSILLYSDNGLTGSRSIQD